MKGCELPARSARLAIGLSLLSVAVIAGCMGSARSNPHENLPEALREYHNELVWGRYGEAASYLPAEQRTRFNRTFEETDGELRFVEYELGTVETDAESGRATVIVKIKWYLIPEYVVEETRVREIWELGEEDDYWWLVRREDADEDEDEDEDDASADLDHSADRR